MSENPYTPPSADLGAHTSAGLAGGGGDFEIGRCLDEAWTATWANFPLWLGVGIVGTLASALAAVTGIGVILLLPHLFWGYYYFVLRMHDGEAEFGDLFAGFSRYSTVLVAMLVGGLIYLVLVALFQSLQIYGDAIGDSSVALLGNLVSIGFSVFLGPRLLLFGFYVVDQDMDGVTALQTAWNHTSATKWKCAAMVLVTSLLLFAGLLLLIVGVIPAITLGYLMWASAYRQIEGRPAA